MAAGYTLMSAIKMMLPLPDQSEVTGPVPNPAPANATSMAGDRDKARPLLLYVLHSGKMYGTERMALVTCTGLAGDFDAVILAPPGPVHAAAAAAGIASRSFANRSQLALTLRPLLRSDRPITFACTSLTQWAVCSMLNVWFRADIRHVHLVHGGATGIAAYGRKRLLNKADVEFVTVSDWARDQLTANGVPVSRITVIPNFLAPSRVDSAPRRGPFIQPGVRRIVTVSRLDRLKRGHLLPDALDSRDDLGELQFKIVGGGPETDALRRRAARRHPNVEFHGYCEDVPALLAESDLLLHLCPVESFGLVALEAMAADLPVLVPDGGGTGLMVVEGESGFKFRPDDAPHLGQRLAELRDADVATLNRAVAGGRAALSTRFSAAAALEQYRRVFAGRECGS